jgi:hypothetical protein
VSRNGTWVIHICEDHRVQDCALCGVFDVVTVVRASDRDRYREALEDIKSVCDERIAGGTGWDYVAISNFVRRTLYDAAPSDAPTAASAARSGENGPHGRKLEGSGP